MTISTYIDDNKEYLDDSALDILGCITEAQFSQIQTNLEDEELSEFGFSKTSKTSETIADWMSARKSWREAGKLEVSDKKNYVRFSRLQMFKGQPRLDIIIIDCGDFRIVIEG